MSNTSFDNVHEFLMRKCGSNFNDFFSLTILYLFWGVFPFIWQTKCLLLFGPGVLLLILYQLPTVCMYVGVHFDVVELNTIGKMPSFHDKGYNKGFILESEK